MTDARSVSLGFWVGIGSVDETPASAGVSHFLEHLLFKGTPNRSAREIAEAVDSVGGDMNAFTTKEYTAFYLRLLADDVELGFDILSDIMWSPAFRPPEVDAERQVILEEILMHNDEPADLVHDLFAGALFADHPLGREVLGEESTIRAMSPEAIGGFHRRHYRPANMVFAAAGAVDHGAVLDGVTRRMNGTSGGDRPPRQAPIGGGRHLAVLERPTEQAHLVVGVTAPARDDPRRHTASILDHILGGGMSSRLFQSIREDRGLAYSVYSYRSGFEGAGALAVYAGTSPSQAAQVLALINEELDRMADNGVTDAELAAARSHLRGSLALGMEDSGARMSRIGHSQLVHDRIPPLDEVVERLVSVSAGDVQQLAGELLSGERTVAAVGPFGDEAVAAMMEERP
ncbi:MAG: insulinase family protein [Actinomycetota bacterium]|nr:insulinase family protein [Actinomycetota bacterium]